VTTKADLINGAYSLMRISGLTVSPSASDLTLALKRLENMAHEFLGRNIDVNYNFENSPTTGALHNIDRKYWFAFETNLAARLLPDFGKEPSPALIMQQQASFSFLSSSTAPVRETTYPTRMPRGMANSRRSLAWSRYYTPESQAPLEGATNEMYVGDTNTFVESFAAYLGSGETISSFTISAETGLTIDTSANATPLITYTITADGLTNNTPVDLLRVKIVVTTSADRVETRIINFKLLDSNIS
jgi:hypothetical protein